MSENNRFSLTGCNTLRFRDEELDLELCYHPLSGREMVAFDGVIMSEERISTQDFGYSFDFNGYDYTLIHDRPEDGSCNYYYQLSRNGEPVQRYEIKPVRNRMPAAIIYLVAFSVVALFPIAAGEISQRFMGISALEWSIGVTMTVIVASVVAAVLSVTAIHLVISGRLIIKNLIGAELKL